MPPGPPEHDLAPQAQRRHQILPIWDLCHYGYPDDLDPLSDVFVDRFARYARAAARYVAEHEHEHAHA